jgi:DNA repair exonuclease SbcCD ATPase subunit
LIGELTVQAIGFFDGPIELPDQRRGVMEEAQKEIAQAKEELLEAKAKLKELSAKLMELSEVMEKIEAAQGRLKKIEEKLFLDSFGKKSFFDRIDDQ